MSRLLLAYAVLIVGVGLIFAPAVMAGDSLDMSVFRSLPVLHEGRIKPLDSFARAELRQITGRETTEGRLAITWLAEALFDPARAAGRKIFVVRDPAVLRQMGAKENEKRFSLQDLAPGLAKTEKLLLLLAEQPPENLTPDQRALLDLHEKAAIFARILGALGMILPLDTPEGGVQATYLDLKKDEKSIREKLSDVVRRKGEDIEKYSMEEKALALTGLQMAVLESEAGKSNLFRIIPPQWAEQENWLSPWESLQSGLGSPSSAQYLAQWQMMAQAYRAGDARGWSAAVGAAYKGTIEKASTGVSGGRFRAEIFYHDFKPFTLAQILYGLTLVIILFCFFRGKDRRGVAFMLAVLGASFHFSGVAARIYILNRPPVGTLYESVLFVALVVVLAALVVEHVRRDGIVLICGLSAALVLLIIKPVFAPAGDSLEMLVAVLNTNFWLATHVIFITAGYGVCMLAALLGHVALFRLPSTGLDKAMHKALLAGLFLTATGTALGGIWADQSWGRFWGWDPKENGALLIVLWIAWVLHGRMGGQFSKPLYFAAASFLSVIVALSWFGVNLLSVGLHSYGFTSGLAAGLLLFCVVEVLVIAAGTVRATKGGKVAAHEG